MRDIYTNELFFCLEQLRVQNVVLAEFHQRHFWGYPHNPDWVLTILLRFPPPADNGKGNSGLNDGSKKQPGI